VIIEQLMTSILRRMGRKYTRFENLDQAIHVPEVDPKREFMLYLHVPFCVVLCPFCSFHRVQYRESKAHRYFDALRREIRMAHDAGYRFREVYVGGGTPTVDVDEMVRTLDLVRELNDVRQISLETNPDDLVPEHLERLRRAGVNRLSVGVQSLEDKLLEEMERREKYGDSRMIRERLASTQGLFDTLNVDLIFNIPHQSSESMLRDVDILTREIGVDQISCYPLMGLKSTAKAMKKDMGLVDYSRERALYMSLLDHLPDNYRPSSAWCFSSSQAPAIDEYIIDQENYIGLGSGAMSYLDGTLYASSFSINHYMDMIDSGHSGITRRVEFNLIDQMRYYFLMRLFGLSLSKAEAESRWGGRFERALWRDFTAFKLARGIRDTGEEWILTRRGMYYWVLMMREFFIAVSNFRDLMRLGIRSELDPEDRATPRQSD